MTISHRGLAAAILFGLVLGCDTLCAEPALPVDWPHLRGPRYDAIAEGAPPVEAWPTTGPPVLWSRDLGEGYSGLIVVSGRVFTQYQVRTGQYVVCFAAENGEELWRERVDWPWQPAGAYPGPYSTPTWHEGRIYYATPAGLVGCLNADDGRKLWAVDLSQRFAGKGTEFGYAGTPLVEDGRVILPVGGAGSGVVALDARDGAAVWAAGSDPASYCPIYPITLGGRRVLVAYLRNTLAIHDSATGDELWRKELSNSYDEHSAWPLFAEPNLLISAPFKGGSRMYQLELQDGRISAKTLWANHALSNDVCSSILLNGCVYGFDLHQMQASPHRTSRGRFKCLDFATGKVHWETDQVGHATVLAAADKLIFLNDTGTLILAKANPAAYEELARAQILEGSLCWTPPTLWQGRLFARNHTHATCVYVGPAEAIPSTPVAASLPRHQRVDWSWLFSREPEYPFDNPTSSELTLWYLWCLGAVFLPAVCVAALIGLAARLAQLREPWVYANVALGVVAAVLGGVGTTVFSAWANAFVFTWPASLYVAFRLTLGTIEWAESQPTKTRPRWVSRTVTLVVLACGYGYYRLCVEVGYAIAWSFLTGFLPAVPAALLATRTRRIWLRALADLLGFTIYFWASGLLPTAKAAWFG